MTIFEALEKGKKLRDERTPQGVREPAPTSPAFARSKPTEPEQASIARFEFEQMPIDPKFCENNRVLMARERGTGYSAVLDSYGILRTRLWARGVGAERWSSLGMVSPGPGEGKSLTSLNLALAFAREKKRNVFLLDLDLRNPSICRYLGAMPKVGIGSVLTGEAKPEEVFFTIGVDNLIVAGDLTSHENSSELLGGKGLTHLMAYINKIDPHAFILVDLPPLHLSADALVVAPKLSAVLLVVSEGVTKRDQLDRTIEVLSGVSVAGIFLNRSRESIEDYYG
jgi:protein-tyrosine kinase